jgi:hypothetical protein
LYSPAGQELEIGDNAAVISKFQIPTGGRWRARDPAGRAKIKE